MSECWENEKEEQCYQQNITLPGSRDAKLSNNVKMQVLFSNHSSIHRS